MASRMSVDPRGDVLFLEGVIDETSQLVELPGRAKNGRLILDLGHIRFINSVGVREWIRMQQAAANLGVRIELRRVCEPLVHQLNIVPAARGVSIVTSFYAPYECDECDAEHEMIIDVTKHGADLARMKPPAIVCPDCNATMDFANPPELYLGFLTGK